MKFRNLFIPSLIFVLCSAVSSFAQSRNESSDVIEDRIGGLETLLQAPEKPATPWSWSFASQGGNYLGVATENLSNDNLNSYGVRDARGVGVKDVVKDSPAEKAGLQKGDVILRFDNEAVTSTSKLSRLIGEAESGHTAQLTISRKGTEQQLTVKLGARSKRQMGLFKTAPGSGDLVGRLWDGQNIGPNPDEFNRYFRVFGAGRRIGVSTSPLTKQLGEYFGARDGGILVSSVNDNGPAAKAGLKAGDVITQVDGTRVESPSDLVKELAKKKDGEVTLTFVRDKSQHTVKVTPESSPATEFRTFDLPQVGLISSPDVMLPVIPNLKDLVVPNVQNLVVPVVPNVKGLVIPDVQNLVVPQIKNLDKLTIPRTPDLVVPMEREFIVPVTPRLDNLVVPKIQDLVVPVAPNLKDLVVPNIKELVIPKLDVVPRIELVTPVVPETIL